MDWQFTRVFYRRKLLIISAITLTNFNRVLYDLVTVPKFVKQSIPQKQIYVFKNVIIR